MELKYIITRSRGEEIVPEEPPVGHSRRNGIIDRAVVSIQDQVMALKSALESRLGEELSADHVALPWMVSRAGNLLSKHHRDSSGWTANCKAQKKDTYYPSAN